MSGARSLVVMAATFLACMPSNQLMPLRGEDPVALEVSAENHGWLERTGATRAVETFRSALLNHDWKAAMARLGPATMAAIEKRAKEVGERAEKVLENGNVPGLGLPGADDPLLALRAPGDARIAEASSFDPSRRKARVLVLIESLAEPIEVPAFFTDDGWRIELVRMLDVTPEEPPPSG